MIERAVKDPFWRFSSAELQSLPVPRLESLSRHWRFQARQLAQWARVRIAVQSLAQQGGMAEQARRGLHRAAGSACPGSRQGLDEREMRSPSALPHLHNI